MPWDLPEPCVLAVTVQAEHIDGLGHANNAVYVQWLEQAAWHHSQRLGVDVELYQRLDRGMAVVRHELDYLAAAYQGEPLEVATWLIGCDRKLRSVRRFQICRVSDGLTLLRGRTTFACVELSTGKPKRMPAEFVAAYGQLTAEA
ncbi:acyl-CoA thioesterase [Atopomonas sediminilitoris]|uniref:acyl-CoA thioesterase n=1 Tax=Atopomonas sediminilitoris TaxID=2919919 RepID=UPI001F4E4B26|nr:thioesterase family protein [Atopomonas sediminilitoris]MCJ8168102.1 acyl-CoA thioesterase [Atopomonas sediminilitoris]